MTTEKVIRITIPGDAPDEFLDMLIASIECAIKALTDQHYGGKLTEAEIEVAVGQLYNVKHRAERMRGGPSRLHSKPT
jgi:hypothetical protein